MIKTGAKTFFVEKRGETAVFIGHFSSQKSILKLTFQKASRQLTIGYFTIIQKSTDID